MEKQTSYSIEKNNIASNDDLNTENQNTYIDCPSASNIDDIENIEGNKEREKESPNEMQILQKDSDSDTLNLNNPTTWNIKSETIKSYLVTHGPQNTILDSYPTTDSRCFNNKWQYKYIGLQKIERKWLFNCKDKDAIYCFPCILFLTSTNKSLFSNFEGYTNWKHLNPNVVGHENSQQHIQNFKAFKKAVLLMVLYKKP